MKILVIDDDEALRRTIAKILRADGHEVLAAENGKRGMTLFCNEQPQIVITDIIMPEQEGIETIVAMRRGNPGVRIIAISGGACAGEIDVLKMAQLLGADDVIEKPFRAADLLERIRATAGARLPA
ncbi:MAG: response regulator [Alphaproteobacteria bacterium]|nr:response regulator [Alphaproteobacteria bacterium]MBV9555357.1 response regulator [Alphaproteobacteria bacterium]